MMGCEGCYLEGFGLGGFGELIYKDRFFCCEVSRLAGVGVCRYGVFVGGRGWFGPRGRDSEIAVPFLLEGDGEGF
jgi:hypothetical protein